MLKNGNINLDCISEDDFVKSIVHRYSQRPLSPEVINDITLFEFATWFSVDYNSSDCESVENDELIVNPLWRTNYNEPPLLKVSRRLPRIILTSGETMRQHQNAKSVTFTCLHDDPGQSMYTLLCLNIPYRNSIAEFLGGNQGL